MIEIEGSDTCLMTSALGLSTGGIVGFDVENASHRTTFSVKRLTCVIYNPDRDTITFCIKGSNNQPHYSTYRRSLVEITTVKVGINPAVASAEKIIKKRFP